MPGADLTTLASILKELYLPPVVEQLNNEVLLLQRLETREATDLFGKRANVPVHTGRSGGVGARGENEVLPAAGSQPYAVATYDLKYLYGRIRVTGPSMAKTRSDAGAFLKALSSEIDGIRADLRKDTARQVYGDGTGKVATCGVTTTSTTVVLSSAEAINKGQLYVGMLVDIGTAADGDTLTDGIAITAVNAATPSITLASGAISTTAANFVYRAGARAADGLTSREVMGLTGIVSTAASSLGGIDASVAGNEYWDNLRVNVAGSLTLDELMKQFNRVRMSGGDPSLLLGTFGIQRKIFNLHQSLVRYTEPETIKGGFKVLEFFGMPVIADLEAPWGKLFILTEKYLKVFSNKDWHFLDEDHSILKWVTDYDAWEAVLARYMEIGAVRRNCQSLLYGITDDSAGY